MSDPTYVNSASSGGTGAANSTCNVPAGVADGDFLLATVAIRGDRTLDAHASWAVIDSQIDGTGLLLVTLERFAASEPASYTFACSGGNSGWAVTISAWRSTDPTVAYSAHAMDAGDLTAPSIDANAGDLLVYVGAIRWNINTAGTWTKPAGMTTRSEYTAGGGSTLRFGIAHEELLLVASGPTGTETATFDQASAGSAASLISLQAVVVSPSSPPVVVPPAWAPQRYRSLGCGVWRAEVFDPVTSYVVGTLDDIVAGTVTRELNQYSTFTCTVGRSCTFRFADPYLRSRLHTWRHWIRASRDGAVVWLGPIVDVKWSTHSVEIEAADVAAFLAKRRIRQFRDFTADGEGAGEATAIATTVIADALQPDNPGVTTTVLPGVGLPAEIKLELGSYAYDVLTNLADNAGLMFTALGATIFVGPTLSETTGFLIDNDFVDDPVIHENGWAAATSAQVVGQAVDAVAGTVDPYYGLLEVAVQDTTLVSTGAARTAAEAIVAFGGQPPTSIEMPSGSKLAATAPVSFDQLIPGSLFEVAVRRRIEVVQMMRLQTVSVNLVPVEQVSVTLVPAGQVREP